MALNPAGFLIRHWPKILVAALFPLFGTLAVYQYRGVHELGIREYQRQQEKMYVLANHFAETLQNEIKILTVLFNDIGHDQIDDPEQMNWFDFTRRWHSWRVYTMDESIVEGFRIHRITEEDRRVWRWGGDGFTMEETTPYRSFLWFKTSSEHRDVPNWFMTTLPDRSHALLHPIDRGHRNWLIIHLDTRRICTDLLPRMAERYLDKESDYWFRILDRDTGALLWQTSGTEHTANFSSPDFSFPLLESGLPSDIIRPGMALDELIRREQLIFDERQELSLRESFSLPESPPLTRYERNPNNANSAVPVLRQGRWVLEAVHRRGSLAGVVERDINRNLSISAGVLLILITAFIALARTVRARETLAERQNEFIASVTHELKTPIAVIRSAASNLAEGIVTAPEKTALYGKTLQKEGVRLSNMIDSLLVYSGLDSRPLPNCADIDFCALVRNRLDLMRAEFEGASIRIEETLGDNVHIEADGEALDIVVRNLLANVLKHANTGYYLGVMVQVQDRFVSLTIQDRGPGIPRRERAQVLKPFFRGRRAHSEQIPGCGMGLSLVNRIVRAHCGTVRLESNHHGTQIHITLPMEHRDARKDQNTHY